MKRRPPSRVLGGPQLPTVRANDRAAHGQAQAQTVRFGGVKRVKNPVKPGHTVFTYILSGQGYFDPDHKAGKLRAENLVLYHPEGDQVEFVTEDSSLRFLLISGKPLGEPVAWAGPIVMNTQEELKIAFEEYQARTFIKHKPK